MNNSRRSFIKNSSATLAGLGLMEFFPSDIYAKMRNKVGANDKINIGLIGLKNQGFNNIRAFLKVKDIKQVASFFSFFQLRKISREQNIIT